MEAQSSLPPPPDLAALGATDPCITVKKTPSPLTMMTMTIIIRSITYPLAEACRCGSSPESSTHAYPGNTVISF